MFARYRIEDFQDTLISRNVATRDTLRSVSDSISDGSLSGNIRNTGLKRDPAAQSTDTAIVGDSSSTDDILAGKQSGIVKQQTDQSGDTTLFCQRNAIADVTFFNPDFVIRSIDPDHFDHFPVLFTESTSRIHSEKRAAAEKHLQPGESLPQKLFHDDWVLGIILSAIILFSVVQASTKGIRPRLLRFFLLRGTKEVSRDMPGIFHWQSTILNISSFLILGLFAFFAASYYEIIPHGIPDFVIWLIMIGIIIIALTLRHIICIGTGNLSGQNEVFRDYLHTVYQFYRFGAFFLFVLVIMMVYTSFLSDRSYFIIAAVILALLYLFRIFRLFIIFINRNISIFYLILYLCALEFLPVLISIKYFSGLA